MRTYKLLSPFPVREVYESGLRSLAAGDYGAAQLAAESLSIESVDPSYKSVLEGGIELRLGRLEQAVALLEPALKFPDTAPLAHTFTGEVLYKSHQFGAAIQVLKQAVKLDDSMVDAHRWLSASYYDIGATGPTVKELMKVSELSPTDPRPHRLAGLIYKDMESYDAAINEYRESLRRSTDFPNRNAVLRELAECLLKAGRHEELDEILEQCPAEPLTLTFAAESKHARGDSQGARRLVNQVLEAAPNHLSALLLKATLEVEASEAAEAVKTLLTAAKLHPFESRVYYQLSQAYTRTGEPELAEKNNAESTRLRDLRAHFTDLHAQASENLDNAEIRFQLGSTARELGLNELAVSWLSAALAIDPMHSQAAAELKAITKQSNSN